MLLLRALINPGTNQTDLLGGQWPGWRSEPAAKTARGAGAESTTPTRSRRSAGPARPAGGARIKRPSEPTKVRPGQDGTQPGIELFFIQRAALFFVPLRKPLFKSAFEFRARQ